MHDATTSIAPTFSILLPVLNGDSTLGAALESIASQTYPDYEVLVLDGQSTDDTLDIIASFTKKDRRFQCYSEKDGGIYDAMNKGLQGAKGNWIFFLGSDDTFFDAAVLATVADEIKRNKTISLIYGNVQLSRPISYFGTSLVYDGEFNADKLLKKNICHQAIFYHASVFKRFGGFNKRYPIFADYDFNLKCFNKLEKLFTNTIITNFNTDGSSGSRQHLDKGFFDDFLENMVFYYAYPFYHPFFNGRKKELFKILRKEIRLFRMKKAFRLVTILAWQVCKQKPSFGKLQIRKIHAADKPGSFT